MCVLELRCVHVYVHLHVCVFQADENIHTEIESTRSIKRRVDHLQAVSSFCEQQLPLWHKTRLDRMLVEYCLRAGYYNIAVMLAKHSNIEVTD